MLDQKAAAQLVIQPVVSACHEIVGMVSSEMSSGSSLTKAAVSRLQVRIVPVASRAAREFAGLLDDQLQSAIKSESQRAEQELSVAQSESMLERSPSVSAMQERVEAELRAYGAEGVRILNAMGSQAMVNASAGAPRSGCNVSGQSQRKRPVLALGGRKDGEWPLYRASSLPLHRRVADDGRLVRLSGQGLQSWRDPFSDR